MVLKIYMGKAMNPASESYRAEFQQQEPTPWPTGRCHITHGSHYPGSASSSAMPVFELHTGFVKTCSMGLWCLSYLVYLTRYLGLHWYHCVCLWFVFSPLCCVLLHCHLVHTVGGTWVLSGLCTQQLAVPWMFLQMFCSERVVLSISLCAGSRNCWVRTWSH